ncbi:MAG: type II toxin-antitoxin system Phd/YefM family antitoxin [Candidatus Aminicenantes bacterium]|nr:type II toxin-antitoxin system Phd/YefM family antitoxin [Candidatus Aminicenantes bacterium]
MKAMGISQFKAHAVEILARIARTKENIVITKRGKPLARVIPYHDLNAVPRPGKLADTLVFEKDIVSPLGEEMWEGGVL